jgi:hypothetical protein
VLQKSPRVSPCRRTHLILPCKQTSKVGYRYRVRVACRRIYWASYDAEICQGAGLKDASFEAQDVAWAE